MTLLGADPDSSRQKVAGILIETSYRNNAMQYAVVGVGINVNQDQAALPSVPPRRRLVGCRPPSAQMRNDRTHRRPARRR